MKKICDYLRQIQEDSFKFEYENAGPMLTEKRNNLQHEMHRKDGSTNAK